MSSNTHSVRRPLETVTSDHGQEAWLSLMPAAQLYPAGTVLVQQGANPADVFFLEDGLAKLVRNVANGREQILGLRGRGWFLGVAFTMIGQSHPASAVAMTSCKVRRLSPDAFFELLRDCPALSWHVHYMHSREVLSQFHHMSDLGAANARQRLERLLRRLAATTACAGAKGELKLALPLKRWELASLIAIRPEHLSRLVKQLCDDGVIRVQKGWIVIPDVERLASDDTEGFTVLTTRPAAPATQ